MRENPNGVVLWEGRSLIDGEPVVVVATFRSENRKTGDMIQTFILLADTPPVDAAATGADVAICGSCPLRGIMADGRNRDRACYVNLGQSPASVWECWDRGGYPRYDPARHRRLFLGRSLRIGAYGDATATPYDAWESVLRAVRKRRTGYTHQWRTCDQRWRGKLMASVETVLGKVEANTLGWRTFRTKLAGDARLPGEKGCPASKEEGNRKMCDGCLWCSGAEYGRGDIVIDAHGTRGKVAAFRRMLYRD